MACSSSYDSAWAALKFVAGRLFLVLASKINAPDVLSRPSVLCLAIAGIVHSIDTYLRLKRE